MGFLREINPHFELEYFTDQENVVVSRYFNSHFALNFQNGGLLEFGLNTNVEQPQEDFPIYPDVAGAEHVLRQRGFSRRMAES